MNLVSLMDIFTILVFFLLVNSSDVQQQGGDKLRLPEARIEKPLEQTLVILVDEDAIAVQGRKIVDINDALMNSDESTIKPLVEELRYLAERAAAVKGPVDERPITLMADRTIEFSLLKKIMASASLAEYTELSLAVISKGKDSD